MISLDIFYIFTSFKLKTFNKYSLGSIEIYVLSYAVISSCKYRNIVLNIIILARLL